MTSLPLQTNKMYAGSFMYHLNEGDTPLVAIGYVVSILYVLAITSTL